MDGDQIYDLSVTGKSTLDFIADFTTMDMSPPRPNYKLIDGRPLVG